MNKQRVLYLDVLRIAAIFCVVVIHTCTVPWNTMSPNDLDWQIINVFDSSVRWCVPVFVMISGALFLDPACAIRPRRLFTHNILRVVTAFLFWSTAYAGLSFVLGLLQGAPITMQAVGSLIHDIITGHYHLWFLFTIAGLYLITPLLRPIAANKRLTEYFLVLSFSLFLIPKLLVQIPALTRTVIDIQLDMDLSFIGGYTFFFLLGDYLHRHGVSDRLRHIIYVLGAVSVVVTVIGTAVWSINLQVPVNLLYNYLMPNTSLTAAAVFLFVKQHKNHIPTSEQASAVITRMSSLTFGIFLCHDFFNITLAKFGISAVSITPLLGVPLISIAVFVGATVVAWGISKIPVISRYIM